MKITIAFISVITLLICMTACGGNKKTEVDAFTINVICESNDIYQIYYSCYFDDKYFGMGGMSDNEHNELSTDTELKPIFSKSYFEGREDVSTFSIDFSPYGKNDTSEIGTTNRVYINAEYGKSYTVIFSGNSASGFTAELQE